MDPPPQLKEKITAEKEELLQKQFQEMEALKVEVTVATTNTQKKQEEAQVWRVYYFVRWEFVRIPVTPSLFNENFPPSLSKGIIKICLLPLSRSNSLRGKTEKNVGRERNCLALGN